MISLEEAKKKLDMLEKKQGEVLLQLKENYELDDEHYDGAEAIKEAVYQGDIELLEWEEKRDFDYADDTVRCQQMLITALELLNAGDKNSIHNSNKAMETLVREARKIRKDKEDDAKKAQEIISLMNEIIAVCDAHRK